MAKPYYEQLNELVKQLNLENYAPKPLLVKHFFSGAALYTNGVICASLSPMGLAFKLKQSETSKLIDSGQAVPLKYFPKGHIKKGYALFESPELNDLQKWEMYFQKTFIEIKNSTL